MHRARYGPPAARHRGKPGITERSAHAIVADLAEAGYVVKQKHGRRNRYQIEAHLPLPAPGTRGPVIGEVLALLLGHTGELAGPPGLAVAGRPGGTPGSASVTSARIDGEPAGGLDFRSPA